MKKKMSRIISLILALTVIIGTAPLSGLKLSVHAAQTKLQVGDIVEFGSYPQGSEGPRDGTKLETLVDEWISMNYTEGDDYSETNYCQVWNNGRMKPTDYRMYADVIYNGVKYRVLRKSAQMPAYTGMKWTRTEVTYSYFKFEPIEWEVIDSCTLRTVKAIDSQPFNQYVTTDGIDSFSDETCTRYSTSFNFSSLKKWLNNDFINSAFSDAEKRNIDGTITIPEVKQASTQRNKYNKYRTTYALSIVDKASFDDIGISWTKTPLVQTNGISSRIVCLNGTNDNAFPATFDVGVVPEIKLIDSCIHNYNSEITKEATCKETGTMKHTCADCGDTYTEIIPLLNEHSFIHQVENATCTEDGSEYDFCTVCENKFNETVLPAAGHNYIPVITAPTCTKQGYTTYTCSCGDSYTVDYTEPTGHSYKDTVIAPTDTEKGYTKHVCEKCGSTFNDSYVDAIGHSYRTEITKTPTCTEKGIMTYTCTTCGDSFTEEISAIGHNYKSAVTKSATCTDEGVVTYTCANCGDKYTQTIPVVAHKLTHTIEKATCVSMGLEYDLCSLCNEKLNEKSLPLTGHTYRNGACAVCGKVEDWDYSVSGGKVTITGYTGNATELEIPTAIAGYPVVSVADSAFAENKKLTFVSVPDSVAAIGSKAFQNCTSLKEVYLGSGLDSIGSNAFAGCKSLALVCVTSQNLALNNSFSNNDKRLVIVAPNGSVSANNITKAGLRCSTYEYPKEKDGKNAIAFLGATTLYQNLDYNFWKMLISKYPDTYYLYFDFITFDGIYSDTIVIDENHIDSGSKYLTLKEVYLNVKVNGQNITFKDFVDLLQKGKGNAVLNFVDEQGQERNFFEKIGDFFTSVFNAISKAINSIVKIFKKK